MTDIVTFLRARLDEDEAAARAAFALVDSSNEVGPWHALHYDYEGIGVSVGPDDGYERYVDRDAVTSHITRHGPARVLAEVEAKRRILELWQGYLLTAARNRKLGNGAAAREAELRAQGAEAAVRIVAATFADHPDYDEAWKVE